MTRVVVDTGPLVALLNRRDRHHAWTRQVLDAIEPPIFTCESVLSESCFLLSRLTGGQNAILELVRSGIVKVDFRAQGEVESLQALIAKFANVPMSFADACLVRMTELDAASRVMTLDGDFRLYRRNRRQVIPVIMP